MRDHIDAIVITADGTATLTQLKADENGGTLAALQATVGGLVDCLRLAEGTDMWVNDEGAIVGLPLNHLATVVAHSVKVAVADGEFPGFEQPSRSAGLDAIAWMREVLIFGNVAITSHDDEGNTTSLTEPLLAFFRGIGLID